MNNSLEYSVADERLRRALMKEYKPDIVVVKAVTHWAAQALEPNGKRAERAALTLRWCKWQRLVNLSDYNALTLWIGMFGRLYPLLSQLLSADDVVAPLIRNVSEQERRCLDSDIYSMQQYFSGLHHDETAHNESAIVKRHLWGLVESDAAFCNTHFWKIPD